ncbi:MULTISPECIES: sensor domain-containing diguanylate cyclase [unclassified Xanthobacter]|uniref:sensor domain-containing diguanylate cyclase n=1 Tax=unclassified Xanthobacter TaxID=2623496 RepID=UPI001EDE40A7
MSIGLLRQLARGPAIGGLTAIIIFLIVAVQAYALWRSRTDALRDATRAGENVLATFAGSIERNLTIVELSLSGLEDALREPGLDELPPHTRQMLLFDRAASAEFLGSMLVIGPDGQVRFDSGAAQARPLDLSDRDYFLAQRDGNVPRFISRPFASRVRGGDPSIAISRRLSGPDGRFDGLVMATIRLSYFRSLFGKVDLGPASVVTLVRTDGTIVFRSPWGDGDGYAGVNLANSPVFRKILAHTGESFISYSVIDGEKRAYFSQKVGSFPLILVVGVSLNDALRAWSVQAIILSALTVLICALLICVVVNLKRALLESYDMEEQLSVMALNDSLTGLPNRRGFGMAAETELRRAAREKKPLAVLVIDVDHFKRINDSWGHPFGDEVLVQIAQQIQRSIRRPGDFAARFGGEEFVVLLPATGREGTAYLAEQIRTNVEGLRIHAGGGHYASPTVSIGATCAEVKPGDRIAPLLRAADEALYEAKGGGRNRVVMREAEQAEAGRLTDGGVPATTATAPDGAAQNASQPAS